MKFETKHNFGKPSDTVIKMFSDRKYFERKYSDLGFTAIDVLDHEKKGDKFRIKVCYTAKNTVAIPEFAKKFIPASAVITQTDCWDVKTKKGYLDVEIKGTPVKVHCDMSLADTAKGSANTLKWTITCGIPLIGGKIEKLTAEDIKHKEDNDVATTSKILEDY